MMSEVLVLSSISQSHPIMFSLKTIRNFTQQHLLYPHRLSLECVINKSRSHYQHQEQYLILTAVTTTTAKCSTLQMNRSTFAVTHAPLLAPIFNQLVAGISCLTQCHPYRLPVSIFFFPAPRRWRRKMGFSLQTLAP